MTNKEYYDNPTRSNTVLINSQRDIFAVSNVIKTEGKCGTIHDRCINSLFIMSKYSGNRVKGKEFPDITVDIQCDKCPNRERQDRIQTTFGKLCRIGSLQGNAWKHSTPHRPCLLVHTYPSPIQEGIQSIDSQRTISQVQVCDRQYRSPSYYDNILILVDTFENIEDRFRIASYINIDILNSDPKELIYYITHVAEFGFDHIIIIGEIEFSMIFLDCYGRVFQWDDESQILWPLGD